MELLPEIYLLAVSTFAAFSSTNPPLSAAAAPIYAFTDDDALFRQLLLPGVEPFLMSFSDAPEQTNCDALAYLKRRNWGGTWLVVITNALAREKVIDTLQLRPIE